MLSKLRQLAHQWLDKYHDVEYFSAHPYAATIRTDLNYRQVLAAVKANHHTYESLMPYMYELDTKNDYQLLRAAVSADPNCIRRARDQKSIPADLLVGALELPDIWELVIDYNWVAFTNPEFKEKSPETAALIELYRNLNLSANEAYASFIAQKHGSQPAPGFDPLALPAFD